MARLLHEITLPLNLTNSNDGQGKAWYRTAKQRKEIETMLRDNGHQRQPFAHPVCLRIVRVLGPKQRLWDADSILRGSAKQLIDSLVACGWFVDDKTDCIEQVVGDQIKDRENGPAVIVQVYDQPARFVWVQDQRIVNDGGMASGVERQRAE